MVVTEVTDLLHRAALGDKQAEADLIPQVYGELRKIAAAHLRRERSDHTLQATALVNEAYLRLTQQRETPWKSRTHFFGIAAHLMRRILVDYARQRRAEKRGGGQRTHFLPEMDFVLVTDETCTLLTEIDEALVRLERMNPRQARVVELRFFSGLTEDETAEVLGRSTRTVKRDWSLAKAWLYGELSR